MIDAELVALVAVRDEHITRATCALAEDSDVPATNGGKTTLCLAPLLANRRVQLSRTRCLSPTASIA